MKDEKAESAAELRRGHLLETILDVEDDAGHAQPVRHPLTRLLTAC